LYGFNTNRLGSHYQFWTLIYEAHIQFKLLFCNKTPKMIIEDNKLVGLWNFTTYIYQEIQMCKLSMFLHTCSAHLHVHHTLSYTNHIYVRHITACVSSIVLSPILKFLIINNYIDRNWPSLSHNRFVQKYMDQLTGGNSNQHIFVPLCGRSRDLKWYGRE